MPRISPLLDLPGVVPAKAKKGLFSDILFVLVFVGIPSSFFAMINLEVFYVEGLFDYRMMLLICSFPYILFCAKNLNVATKLPSVKALLLLCLYIVFSFFESLNRGIPIAEVIKVLRVSLLYPFVCLAAVLYLCQLDLGRIFRLYRWIFIVMFAQACLYLFSNVLGIEIFQAKGKEALDYQGEKIMQNVFATPLHNHIVFCIAFLASLVKKDSYLKVVWACAITVIVLSFVRNQLVVYLLSIILMSFLGVVYVRRIKISRGFLMIMLISVGVVLIVAIFPTHMKRLKEKIGGGLESGLESGRLDKIDTGTFDLRVNAIKGSVDNLYRSGDILIGSGYVRDSKKGTYSFVMGSDTLIPPILLTEGFIGLVFYFL